MRFHLRQHTGGLWEAVTPDGAVLTARPTSRDRAAALLASAWRRSTGITAAAPPEGGREFWAVLGFVGVETDDGRLFDAMEFRTPPLPFFEQFVTDDGHDGAEIVGRLDDVAIDGLRILGHGWYDGSEAAQRAVRHVEEQTSYGVSVDVTSTVVPEFECMAWDDDGWCTQERARWASVVLLGATQVGTPAFAGAQVSLTGFPETTAEPAAAAPDPPEGAGGDVLEVLFASGRPGCGCGEADAALVAAGVPSEPPAEWFADPQLGEPTPLTVGDDGRVFGHIATWGSCHVGVQDSCVRPPRSETGYAYFRTGTVRTADGTDVPVGSLTIGTGHADTTPGRLTYRQAAAHYDDTGTAVADLAAGEDDYGIWVAGALRPGVTEEQLRAVRGSAPSGDWRRISGNLELVAVLGVNVPGYPTPRQAVAASGQVEALVAAGSPELLRAVSERIAEPWRAEVDELRSTVGRLSRVVDAMLPAAADALAASVRTA